MKRAVAEQTHSEGFVQIEIIDTKQLHVVFHLREESTLDLESLRGERIRRRDTLQPVDDVRNPERDGDHEPLADAVDNRRVSNEELPFDFGLLGIPVRDEVRVAKPAL